MLAPHGLTFNKNNAAVFFSAERARLTAWKAGHINVDVKYVSKVMLDKSRENGYVVIVSAKDGPYYLAN